jgi:hypothetical protein
MSGKQYYGYQGHGGRKRGGDTSDGLFGWTIFIFLLIGLVFVCWMGSYYIFARPENAANYRLLQRLHKLEPPQRFEITAAPRGEFLKPSQILERFGSMTPGEISRNNRSLLRAFILNYHQNRDLVPYAVGTYRVIGTLHLSQSTFCNSGVVALLQAVEQPEVLLEQVFTASPKNLAALDRALSPGQEIKLEKPLDLSAIVHIDRLPDDRIKLTTMPLLYGSYGSGQGPASFSLEPPAMLNMEAGLPIVTSAEIDQLSNGTLGKSSGSKTPHHLSRITEETSTPTPTPSPSPTVAKAIPVQTPPRMTSGSMTNVPVADKPVARAIPVNTTPVLPAIPVNAPADTQMPSIAKALPVDQTNTGVTATPAPTPAPVAVAFASPTPFPAPTVNPTPKPLPKPSGTPVMTAAIPPSGGNLPTNTMPTTFLATPTPQEAWPVYAPGLMPRGSLLEPPDTAELVSHGATHERHYLRGRFSVTASGNGKAVLRPESALAGLPMGQNGKIRVIVEFPPGATPPPEGNTISRDSLRPFQITSVKRGDDGQINVYAREVTRGE